METSIHIEALNECITMADTTLTLKDIFQQGYNTFKKIETDESSLNSDQFQVNKYIGSRDHTSDTSLDVLLCLLTHNFSIIF